MKQANENAQQTNNLIQTAESGLSDISGMLSRMRELATQAATDTLNDSDRTSINLEFEALKNEVSRVAHATEYNEMNLLNGTDYKNEVHRANTTADDVRGISIKNAKLSNDIRKGIYTLSDQHVDVSNQADISNLSGTAITEIRYSASSLQPALGETHSINSQVNPAEVDIINGGTTVADVDYISSAQIGDYSLRAKVNSGDADISGMSSAHISQISHDANIQPGNYTVRAKVNSGDADISGVSSAHISQISHNASVQPGTYTISATGLITSNHVLSLESTNDYMIVNPISGFPSNEITVEFWMKSSDTANAGTPFSYASSSADNDFLIYDYRNVHSFIGGPAISTGVSANDGAWHHLAVTWQSSNGDLKVFKDGVVDYSGTLSAGSTMMPAGSLVIGQDQDIIGGNFESNQAFIGSIDEIRIWNHSRTQEEIQTTMNTILDGDESGLVGYWNFNDGTAIDGSAQIPSTANNEISLSPAADLTVQAPGGTSQTIPYTSGAQTINFSSLGITVNSSNVSNMTADLLVNAETFTVNPTLEVTPPVGSGSATVDAGYTFASTSVEFDDSLSTDLGLEIHTSNASDMTADLLVAAETFTVNPTLEVTTPASTVHENGYDFNSQTTITFPGSLGIDVDTSDAATMTTALFNSPKTFTVPPTLVIDSPNTTAGPTTYGLADTSINFPGLGLEVDTSNTQGTQTMTDVLLDSPQNFFVPETRELTMTDGNGIQQSLQYRVGYGDTLDFDDFGIQLDIKGSPNHSTPSADSYNPHTDSLDGKQIEIAPNRDLQVGADNDVNHQLKLGITSVTATGLKIENESVVDVDLARVAITSLDVAIDVVNQERSYLASEQNRLAFTMSNLTSQTQNIEASRSSIEDADFAADAADLAKNQILAQSATAMLAQASAISQNILSLLR